MVASGSVTDRLIGRWVLLRPLVPEDYPRLYLAEAQPESAPHMRSRGRTVAPEEYSQTLWTDVLAQYSIVRKDNLALAGLATAYAPDFRNQVCHIAGLVVPKFRMSAWPLEGFRLFIDYVFRTFPFPKSMVNVASEPLVRSRASLVEVGKSKGGLPTTNTMMGPIGTHSFWHLRGPIGSDHGWRHLARDPLVSSVTDVEVEGRRLLDDFGRDASDGREALEVLLREDLGFDSVDLLVLLEYLEEKTGRQLSEELIHGMRTVGDVARFIVADGA